MKVNNGIDNQDWIEIFARLSPDRRSKILNRAALLIADDQANPNEQATSRRQLQAALEVDPKLVLDVLASVRGNGVPNADVEKLKQEAENAQAKFEGLVTAVQSLRVGLTEIGAIKENADLPGTADEWKNAIGNVVARESRQLTAQRDHLIEQKRELEKMRMDILGEIKAEQGRAKALLNNVPVVQKGVFSTFKSKVTEARADILALSFAYDHIEAPEVAQLIRGEGIFTRLWTPRFADGRAVPVECELYTSPQDLRYAPGVNGLQTYLNSVRAVESLKDWHGHDGRNFVDSDDFVDFIDKKVKRFASKNQTSLGEWFRPDGIGLWALPPREIVDGKIQDEEGKHIKISNENHFDLRNTGAFKGTFNTEYNGSGNRYWYWSSTEHRQDRDPVWFVDFRDGDDVWLRKDNIRLSARPVRVGRVRHLTI